MKYKELPECKNVDEFAIGDMVNIYDDGNHLKDMAVNSIDGNVLLVSLPLGGFNSRTYQCHFKQCRKLEPIKAREFWVNCYEDDSGHIMHVIHNSLKAAKNIGSNHKVECIHIREVLDED